MCSLCMIYLFSSIYFQPVWELKDVFCVEHVVGPCFSIQSGNLCLLNGVSSPLTFNAIIDMVGFKSTILLFPFFYPLYFIPLFPFCLLLDYLNVF